MSLGFRTYIIAVLLLGASVVQLFAQDSATYANKTLHARSWGNYPIVVSNEVKGGIHHIASLSGSNYAEINDSIPAERRQVGMLCVVGNISWTASDLVLMYNGTTWNRINYTRVWESGQTYYNGQTVFEDGQMYIARVANASSQPSANTTQWHNVADKLNQILVLDADADDALTYSTTNYEYDINVDNSTIEISGDDLQVKDLGITTGKLANNAVTATKLAVTGNGTSGQILSSNANGTFFWEDASNLTVDVDAYNINLLSASILVGNSGGVAEERVMSGDVVIDNKGITTVAGLVTNATAISAEATTRSTADASLQSELDATQTGAGLGIGGAYTANGLANYISTSTSLTDANNDLDAAIKANADAISSSGTDVSNLQDEIDAIEAGSGLDSDGDYVVTSSANYIAGAATLNAADVLLDTQVKSNADGISTNASDITSEETARIAADATLTSGLASEVTNRSNADASLQSELDATQTGAGLGTGGAYTANGSANYISSSTSLTDADNDLDAAIKINTDAISNGTSDLQNEVNAIEVGSGLASDGDYVVTGSANYISGASSLNNADVLLDTQVKTNADATSTNATAISTEATTRATADNTLQNNIDAINQLNSAQIYVGNSSNTATARTMNGDAVLSNVGALSINNNVIGADELDVSDNGTAGQVLSSDNSGGFTWETIDLNVSTVSFVIATKTLNADDQGVIMCNGNLVLNLPNASAIGLTYTVKNIGTGKVTIEGNGSQTIDGEGNYPLDEQYASITIVSYNSAWYIVDRQSKNTVHIGNPGINGSWRITLGSGNSLSFEQYDTSVGGGTWVYKMEIED